ncbi:MAG: hypothetical protein AAGN46_18570, partial [Acidobacteriota bacterium]
MSWVEVVDGGGRSLGAPIDTAFQIREGTGSPIAAKVDDVLAGRPLAETGDVVVWFDPALATSGSLRRLAAGLAESAERLVGLGRVELVEAGIQGDDEVLVSTQDPLVVRERLGRLALSAAGRSDIESIRRRTLDDYRRALALPDDAATAAVIAGIKTETTLVAERLERLLLWLGDAAAGSGSGANPRALILGLDGFDLDPIAYYATVIDTTTLRGVTAESARLLALDAQVDELSRSLAALGWATVAAVLPARERRGLEASGVADASGSGDVLPGITIRPGRLFGRDDDEADEEPEDDGALRRPLEPLRRIAEATAGHVVESETGVRDALDRLARRVPVTWTSSLDPSAGVIPLEIAALAARRGARASGWRSVGTPEPLVDLRLERVLERGAAGDLDVAAVLEISGTATDAASSPSTVDVRLDSATLDADLRRGDLRLTVTATGAEGSRRLLRQIERDVQLVGGEGWRLRQDLELPADATGVAILVEDLASGLWGGRRAAVVRAGGDAVLPEPRVVEVERPDGALLRGRTDFRARVLDPRVARVEFLLDDRGVGRADRPPWEERIDLGRTPRRQTLAAVAYDAAGRELGRDEVVLNGGDAALGVRIVEPSPPRGVGSVDVAAEISVPVERQLDRV